MSELSAVQVPTPRDEQAFERCNRILWRCILNDETAHLYGRRGQRQFGVDIVGCRNGKPNQLVGIQCKLKTDGRLLREEEVRGEVAKATDFHPPLSEYVIVTTAPDDAKIQSLAKDLSAIISETREIPLQISVLGWDNLQLEIQRYPEALKAFNPSHTPQGEEILETVKELPENVSAKLAPEFELIRMDIAALRSDKVDVGFTSMDSEYEELINDYVALIPTDPEVAMESLQRLQARLEGQAGSRIQFRIVTNIAACRLELGDEENAAAELIAAWEIAPEEPKAIVNKAFGHLLRNEWTSARDIARQGLAERPDDAPLAAIYIRSLIRDESVDDPTSLIPAPLRYTPEVEQAYVVWLIHRGKPHVWWGAAIDAHARHPGVIEIEEMYANALLSQAMGGEKYVYGQELHGNGLHDVEMAIEVYERLWDTMRSRARRQNGNQSAIALNLMLAYRIVGRNDSAKALGWEAVERFPEDASVKEQLAWSLLEGGETDKALQVVSDLEENGHGVAIRYKIAVACEDWETIRRLADRYGENAPESERLLTRAFKLVARMELEPPEKAQQILEMEHGEFCRDALSSIILCRSARSFGLDALSQFLFDSAVSAFQKGDADFPSRLAIAEEAMIRGQPSVAVDALDGRVALDRESNELRLLANALVVDMPIRARAVRFFEELHADIAQLAFFQKLQGVLHFNRGEPAAAAKPLANALKSDRKIETLMCLVRALYQSDDKEEIRRIVGSEQVETFDGTALDRIELSHVFLDFSEPARALQLAYTSVTEDHTDAEVVKKFVGLVIRATSGGWEPEKHPKVGSGTWVRLVRSGGQSFEALIGEVQDRPWGQAIETDNSFVARCLGLREEDEFEAKNSLGSRENWKVTEIKPWWLQAFHHLTGDFEQRFPEARGFATFPIVDDDLEPVLEQVRRHSAMVREQADVYLTHPIPLVMASGHRPGGVVAFAQYLVSIGKQVRVCTGKSEERDEALTFIRENDRSGAVIDAFTAWHAATLGVLPAIKERVGDIAIPANELGQLKAMREEWTGDDEGDSMSMDYREGEYVRFVETAEDRKRRLDRVTELIAAVEGSCAVEPLQSPDRLSEIGEKLVGLPPSGAFAAAVMAGESRLLLCEDLEMRRLARDGFGAKGIWLQAVLSDAEQAGTISFNTYADSVVYLAHLRHSYVSVNARVLLSVYERDDSRDLVRLEVLCLYVGDECAEIDSHTAIASEFVNTIWANSKPFLVADEFPADWKTRKATNLVIRALLEERREGDWAKWAAALYRGLSTNPRRYLLRWCEDKFLPVGQLLASFRQSEN